MKQIPEFCNNIFHPPQKCSLSQCDLHKLSQKPWQLNFAAEQLEISGIVSMFGNIIFSQVFRSIHMELPLMNWQLVTEYLLNKYLYSLKNIMYEMAKHAFQLCSLKT